MADLDQNPLKAGDIVDALRYDLGKSKIIKTEKGLAYESLETGKVVLWHLMIDAATELQKVRKLDAWSVVAKNPFNNIARILKGIIPDLLFFNRDLIE